MSSRPPPDEHSAPTNERRWLADQLTVRARRVSQEEPKGKDANQIAFATYQMYEAIREQFIEQLVAAGDTVWDDATELTLLGGIMINRAEGGDRFLPLNLEMRTKEGGETTVDLFTDAFGESRGDLSTALGSAAKTKHVYAPYSLSALDDKGNAKPL